MSTNLFRIASLATLATMAVTIGGCSDADDPSDLEHDLAANFHVEDFAIRNIDLRDGAFKLENAWTWVPLEGTQCSDGSETGMAVNPGTNPSKMMFFMDGGGACGDYSSCFLAKTANLGPFTGGEFTQRIAVLNGSLADKDTIGNPFSEWTMVYVPYCTGDMLAGDKKQTYTLGPASQDFYHMGRANVTAATAEALKRYPTLETLVVVGESAGAYGALANYIDVRSKWPSAEGYLIGDSGPLLEGTNTSMPFLQPWITNWGIYDWIGGNCPECITDLSMLMGDVAKRFPNDRLALLESLQDSVIAGYYGIPGALLQVALETMTTDRLVPLAHYKYFYVSGSTHTMINNPSMFTSGTTPLITWVDYMLNDSPAWESTQP